MQLVPLPLTGFPRPDALCQREFDRDGSCVQVAAHPKRYHPLVLRWPPDVLVEPMALREMVPLKIDPAEAGQRVMLWQVLSPAVMA